MGSVCCYSCGVNKTTKQNGLNRIYRRRELEILRDYCKSCCDLWIMIEKSESNGSAVPSAFQQWDWAGKYCSPPLKSEMGAHPTSKVELSRRHITISCHLIWFTRRAMMIGEVSLDLAFLYINCSVFYPISLLLLLRFSLWTLHMHRKFVTSPSLWHRKSSVFVHNSNQKIEKVVKWWVWRLPVAFRVATTTSSSSQQCWVVLNSTLGLSSATNSCWRAFFQVSPQRESTTKQARRVRVTQTCSTAT